MAGRSQSNSSSWLLVEEHFETGAPAFVDELCRCDDAEKLGNFASRWLSDRRPESREFLSRYLDQPLNHARHEALVKRLFKLAEKAEDDKVMAWMMVAFDRSIRRQIRKTHQYDWQSRESWEEERLVAPPDSALPRDPRILKWMRNLEERRLFSLKTRRYLRRRSWRYFRNLGNTDPVRYIKAISVALDRYRDDDVGDGVALLDNWGMIHAMFHHSKLLQSPPVGWTLAEDASLADLSAAPAFPTAWKTNAQPLLRLLTTAQCRPVRQWCIALLRADHADAIQLIDIGTLISWLASEQTELAEFAIESLQVGASAAKFKDEHWLALLSSHNPAVIASLCNLAREHLAPDRLTLDQIVSLAVQPSALVARLANEWLQTRTLSTRSECLDAFNVCEARSESTRETLVATAIGMVAASPAFTPELALEPLDSRYSDVRKQGWQWLISDARLTNETLLWQRLIESPYDNIQLPLAELLEQQLLESKLSSRDIGNGLIASTLDDHELQRLWAAVLLNTRRGSRRKPGVILQVINHLMASPDQADRLEPLLAVGLKSIRRPEWKATIAGLTQLAERHPNLRERFQSAFVELTFSP
ncbi:hypothetical protein [Rhodopirellula sp. MGV]|uniref:hypothetical protein n=1 Tax=Rhodopirellula sp. MGV TaxID=2023130 RepID=UPI000B95E128|nr:hypothetical protein [Rhodopirellula sp. MGV]OYP28295.1 hypothetical protein CGZ80_26095 [Rhodopirellula sp. MGV]PNY38827.1 hypothetical protein C2E31_02705 [Rhodopirellula baltica]